MTKKERLWGERKNRSRLASSNKNEIYREREWGFRNKKGEISLLFFSLSN
jgi:hypothetical protein